MSSLVLRQGASCSRGVALSARLAERTIYPFLLVSVKGHAPATTSQTPFATRRKAGW